MAHELVISS